MWNLLTCWGVRLYQVICICQAARSLFWVPELVFSELKSRVRGKQWVLGGEVLQAPIVYHT